MTTYIWKSKKRGDAQPVGEALERIREKTGKLIPGDVVKVARRSTSQLHRFFTWEDGEAASKWRIQEARQLINVIAIEVPKAEDTKSKAPAFVSVKVESEDKAAERYYQASEIAVKNIDEFQSVLYQLRRKIRGLQVGIDQLVALAASRGDLNVSMVAEVVDGVANLDAKLSALS